MAAAIGSIVGARAEAQSPDSRSARFLACLQRAERWVLAAALLLLNLHLIPGLGALAPAPQAFSLGRFLAGEWWLTVTHPFVHVSWYHLLLDGSAFLLILAGLGERAAAKRWLFIAASAAGSLAAAQLGSPEASWLGYRGLSGAAHGLMAVSALEMARAPGRDERTLGRILFLGTAAKCLLEALTGRCLLELFHFGLLGTPLAIAHAGGFLGGSLAWGMAGRRRANVAGPRFQIALSPSSRAAALRSRSKLRNSTLDAMPSRQAQAQASWTAS